MRIKLGSGRRSKTFELVHGSVVKRSPENEQRMYVENVCDILGIK